MNFEQVNKPDLIPLKQTAEILGVGVSRLKYHILAHQIRAIRLGNYFYFNRSDIEWLERYFDGIHRIKGDK